MYLISGNTLKMILLIGYYFLKIIGLTPARLQLAQALYEAEYPHKTSTTENIEVCKAIVGTIIVLILWLTITIKQKTAVRIFNTCVDIDYSMVKYHFIYRPESATRRLTAFFSINVFIWIMLVLSDYLSFDKIPFITFISSLGPNFIFNWLLITYTGVIVFLEMRVRAINQGIMNLSECSISSCVNYPEIASAKFILHNVLLLKSTRERLFNTIRDVSTFCSFSIMLIIAELCGSIVYTSYYLIAPIVMESLQASWLLIFNSICYLAMEIFPIGVMCVSISRILTELSNTATAVHRLFGSKVVDRELRSQLKIFALELLHKNIEFTACGLFPLDCTLLHSICSMTVTYLIILIQFQSGSCKKNKILAPNKFT